MREKGQGQDRSSDARASGSCGFSRKKGETEAAIRARLGIPDDARRVLVLAESSHWDPNWLLTSEEYFRFRVRRVLDRALRELEADPRRVFSVECVFFLKMYWDRRAENRDAVRRLVNEGRLRLTGSGMTTPDTLLPETETILRDYVLGQDWLRQNGMTQEPCLAYLPDNFGLSPTVPTILNALGFTMASVCRIDGSYFPGADYAGASSFPRPGSSAELLSKELKTTDFIWVGPDGSRVLCHWNPFTYGQGDMIASRGLARILGLTLGIPDRSAANVSSKIDRFVRQLSPLARTPYLFCPIGFDFNSPIRELIPLLDEYNRRTYPESGIFAVNAGMDDYLDLVASHPEEIPELPLDMNPYWMGFYASRPEMKQRCKRLARDLVAAEERLALEAGDGKALLEELKPAWETAVVANHHDFITGTSPERVWKKEQRPWLVEAQRRVDRVAERAIRISPSSVPEVQEVEPPAWSLDKGILHVETRHYKIEVSEALGGCISKWTDPDGKQAFLAGAGNDAIAYEDSGGLWRMGHEFAGGTFRPREYSSRGAATIRASLKHGVLRAEVESYLEGRRLLRSMLFRADSPFVRMEIKGSALKRRTVTCRFPALLNPAEVQMDVPGGVVSRPLVKIYDPTFWAASSFAHLVDPATEGGVAVFMAGPASIRAAGNGIAEWVALRNAPRERAFGFLPVLAHPAYGEVNEETSLVYAVGFTQGGDWHANRLHVLADRVLSESFADPGVQDPETRSDAAFSTGSEDVRILAVKPAGNGDGIIVRLQSFGRKISRLACNGKEIDRAVLCDAREGDLEEIPCKEGRAEVRFVSAIASVRIFLRE